MQETADAADDLCGDKTDDGEKGLYKNIYLINCVVSILLNCPPLNTVVQ